ncbi:unnamed protein product [Brassica oleracea var. botrytis]
MSSAYPGRYAYHLIQGRYTVLICMTKPHSSVENSY